MGYNLANSYIEGALVNPASSIDAAKVEAFLSFARTKEEIDNSKQNRYLRLIVCFCVFVFVCYYTNEIIAIVDRTAITLNFYHLDSEVLITLLSTTCINIISLLAFVVRYLFPSSNKVE